LLPLEQMKILEARFHPPPTDRRRYVVVGHVIVEADGARHLTRVKPCSSLAKQAAPATILATLRHLTRMTAPGSWERLQSLRSRHWTFVPIDPVVSRGEASGPTIEVLDDQDPDVVPSSGPIEASTG
jgi:hypothetical protein